MQRHALFDLGETVKQALLIFGGDTDATVLHFDAQLGFLRVVLDPAADPQGDAALFGKLDRVVQQVQQNLAEPQRVTAQQTWHIGRDFR